MISFIINDVFPLVWINKRDPPKKKKKKKKKNFLAILDSSKSQAIIIRIIIIPSNHETIYLLSIISVQTSDAGSSFIRFIDIGKNRSTIDNSFFACHECPRLLNALQCEKKPPTKICHSPPRDGGHTLSQLLLLDHKASQSQFVGCPFLWRRPIWF